MPAKSKRKFFAVLAGIVITFALMFLRGRTAANLVFPYRQILFFYAESLWWLGAVLMVTQFPLYFLAVSAAGSNGRRIALALFLILVHAAAAATAFHLWSGWARTD